MKPEDFGVTFDIYQDGSVYMSNIDSSEGVRLARNSDEFGCVVAFLLEHLLNDRDAFKALERAGFDPWSIEQTDAHNEAESSDG